RKGELAMKRFGVGAFVALLLGLAGAAHANEVFIDFTGSHVVSHGLTQVNSSRTGDGFTRIVQRAGMNLAKTGGTDAARYLRLKISPAFKANLKSAWVTVTYEEDGTDGFRLEYDGTSSSTATVGPSPRLKYDSEALVSQ